MMLPKADPVRDRDWLNHLRDQPCILTGQKSSAQETVDPAHLRFGRTGGMGMKPNDNHALPLLHSLHMEQHQKGELSFWRTHITNELLREALIALAEKKYAEWKVLNGRK